MPFSPSTKVIGVALVQGDEPGEAAQTAHINRDLAFGAAHHGQFVGLAVDGQCGRVVFLHKSSCSLPPSPGKKTCAPPDPLRRARSNRLAEIDWIIQMSGGAEILWDAGLGARGAGIDGRNGHYGLDGRGSRKGGKYGSAHGPA
jgi:hypothetical protein